MRAYVYADARTTRALMLLDCKEFTAREAKVPGHVDLSGVLAGMVVRPADEDGRRPDASKAYVVGSVDQRPSSLSSIRFDTGAGSAPSREPSPPVEAPPEK